MKTYDEYIDSGVEWIGKIPKEWKVAAVKNAFDVVGSGTTPSVGVSEYYGGNIPWINTGDLEDGPINMNEKYITQKALDDYSALRKYPKESIIIAMYGATIGKLGILTEEATVNQACCVLSKKDSGDIFYDFYALMVMRKNLVAMALGGGQPNISQDMVKNAKIPIAPSKEKRKIVSYLDAKCSALDTLIAAKEAQNSRLKEYRQSIITAAVTKGLNPSVPMQDSGIEWIGKIPKGWKVVRIKHLATLKGRIGWQGLKVSDYVLEGPYLITGTDFEKGSVNWNKCVHITKEKYDEDDNIHVDEHDLLITKDGTIGKLAIAANCPREVTLNSGIFLIRSLEKDLYYDKFLYFVLMSGEFWHWFNFNLKGNSTIVHLNQENFYDFSFAIPTFEKQQEIVSYLDAKCSAIDNVLETNSKIIAKLKEYKQSLIYEVVTGKRRVS